LGLFAKSDERSWLVESTTALASNLQSGRNDEGGRMLGTILIILLILLLIGAIPAWPYSRGWGYYPSSGLGLLLLIVILLLLLGYL
jgi:hypothetical protein